MSCCTLIFILSKKFKRVHFQSLILLFPMVCLQRLFIRHTIGNNTLQPNGACSLGQPSQLLALKIRREAFVNRAVITVKPLNLLRQKH